MHRGRSWVPLWSLLSLLAVGTTGFLLSLLAIGTTGIGTTGSTRAYSAPPKTGGGAQLVGVQLLREAAMVRSYSGMGSKQRLVIRDATTWAATWKEMTSIFGDLTRASTPTVPEVDFTKSVLIVAAMGARTSGGYWIDIDEVRIAANEVLVGVSEHSPSGCGVTAGFTAPVAIAVVPRFAGPATFVERTVQHECR